MLSVHIAPIGAYRAYRVHIAHIGRISRFHISVTVLTVAVATALGSVAVLIATTTLGSVTVP